MTDPTRRIRTIIIFLILTLVCNQIGLSHSFYIRTVPEGGTGAASDTAAATQAPTIESADGGQETIKVSSNWSRCPNVTCKEETSFFPPDFEEAPEGFDCFPEFEADEQCCPTWNCWPREKFDLGDGDKLDVEDGTSFPLFKEEEETDIVNGGKSGTAEEEKVRAPEGGKVGAAEGQVEPGIPEGENLDTTGGANFGTSEGESTGVGEGEKVTAEFVLEDGERSGIPKMEYPTILPPGGFPTRAVHGMPWDSPEAISGEIKPSPFHGVTASEQEEPRPSLRNVETGAPRPAPAPTENPFRQRTFASREDYSESGEQPPKTTIAGLHPSTNQPNPTHPFPFQQFTTTTTFNPFIPDPVVIDNEHELKLEPEPGTHKFDPATHSFELLTPIYDTDANNNGDEGH